MEASIVSSNIGGTLLELAWRTPLGRDRRNMRTKEGLNKGIAYFRDAIEKDPHYALAHVGLAESYIALAGYRIVPGKGTFPAAKEEALKAVAIDARLGEAYPDQ
jgi:hypothetical protein